MDELLDIIRNVDVQAMIEFANSDNAKLLNESIEDCDAWGDSKSVPCLHHILDTGSEPFLQAALRFAALGVDAASQPDGRSALACAAINNKRELAARLLAAGASPNARDSEGYTPLLWAAASGADGVLRLLLAAGGDARAREHSGWSALHLCANGGHASCARTLVAHAQCAGASDDDYVARFVNAVNQYNQTALFCAAQHGFTECVHFLLSKGADPTIVTTDGETALSSVSDWVQHADIVRALDDALTQREESQ